MNLSLVLIIRIISLLFLPLNPVTVGTCWSDILCCWRPERKQPNHQINNHETDKHTVCVFLLMRPLCASLLSWLNIQECVRETLMLFCVFTGRLLPYTTLVCVQLSSPGAAVQSNLKMKHLGLLRSAKIFQILFLHQVGSGFRHWENAQLSYYPLIRKSKRKKEQVKTFNIFTLILWQNSIKHIRHHGKSRTRRAG